jgi:hypothetical protein
MGQQVRRFSGLPNKAAGKIAKAASKLRLG